MIKKLKTIYLDWQYIDDHKPAGWRAFWEVLKFWWIYRPKLSKCSAGCGTVIWKNGNDNQFIYCGEGCAYYGPSDHWVSLPEDEIPF